MKKLRITERNIDGKIVYVIQQKLSFFVFSVWVDLDKSLRMTKKRTWYYEDRLEAKNCIRFSWR
jgi:hypothetical protein